jgi:hypothetical protein
MRRKCGSGNRPWASPAGTTAAANFPLDQIAWPNNDGNYLWNERAPHSFKERQPVLGEARKGI